MYKFHILLILSSLLVTTNCKEKQETNKTAIAPIETVSKKDSLVEKRANTAEQILSKKEVPILCYHRIDNETKGDYTVSLATFTSHIKTLSDSGYHSVLPDQLYDYLVFDKPLPEKPFMITFDDSRIEHFQTAAPILEKYGFRGVFFIMTITYNKKNYMTKEQIAQLSNSGHTIGLHSWDHTMATKYDSIGWEKQVKTPKKKLEEIINTPVNYWAYPNGVYNQESAAELSKYFKISFSLSSKQDTLFPLQSVRRIIIPDFNTNKLIQSMSKNFK